MRNGGFWGKFSADDMKIARGTKEEVTRGSCQERKISLYCAHEGISFSIVALLDRMMLFRESFGRMHRLFWGVRRVWRSVCQASLLSQLYSEIVFLRKVYVPLF